MAKESITKAADKLAVTKIEEERLKFSELVLVNPNHFGNIKESPYPVKKLMSNNTTYEEVTCVGYNPQTKYLEAVVAIKQVIGYGGPICSQGTGEYVRFFLSYDSGITWKDQGVASFTACDVPGPKPLEYSVRLRIDPTQRSCRFENMPKVRAILSWNQVPADDPDFPPVYGNCLEANIQIGTTPSLVLKDVLELGKISLPKELIDVLDPDQLLAAKPPIGPGPVELASTYMKNKIQPHRLLSVDIETAVKQPSHASKMFVTPEIENVLKTFDVDISKVIAAYLDTDGDTSYEKLGCVGMSQGSIDWLTATFSVIRPYGFMGGLCTNGSMEYIAFWVDWEDGAGWNYAGTGAVQVHDLDALPKSGLRYSVSIPVNTLPHRQPCSAGPKTARVRAILSWQTAPPAGNPDFVPHWGNRKEVRVLLQPSANIIPEDSKLYVDSIGNMAVSDIDQTSGLATGQGQIAAFYADQAPFGGSVRVTGFIINPPNAMADPAQTLKYRVKVRRLDGTEKTTWQPLTNDFDIVITEQNGTGLPVQHHHKQQIDADGFYTYWEQAYTNQWRQVAMDKLASWETYGLPTGLWELSVEVKLPSGTILPAGVIVCPDGSTRSNVRVRTDNGAPSANIKITGYIHSTDPTIHPAKSCGSFMKGDTIVGEYSTADPESNWFYLTIHAEPVASVHGALVAITPTASSSSGQSGTWRLDTELMDPCGYIVYLWTTDRTIVNSGYIGWQNGNSTGFCLTEL